MQIVGVDTGGTFTDLAYYDAETGEIRVSKIASTPRDPSIAVVDVLRVAQPTSGAGSRIVHGTTVATNALLEGKGARVATVNTIGFRDLLQIGRTRRASPGLFNTKFVKAPPLVSRPYSLELDERIDANGVVLRAVEPQSLERLAEELDRLDPDVVVVCLLHSYRNPSHEQMVGTFLRTRIRGGIVLSSDVVPEFREYERLTTTVVNGFVLPKMESYLNRLGNHAASQGRPLYVMASNGGIMTAARAATLPVRTILSGPAGGVNGALLSCRQVGVRNFITCDMGGTSTDVALVHDLSPRLIPESMISGVPIKTPQLDINTVGAGGGSIAWVDVDGSLRVGPRSAGAVPGPACYGRGGAELTVTDADLLLGRLASGTLLGGQMQLDREAASRALQRLARAAQYADAYGLAEGVIRLAVARMVSAIREISVERGFDPREFVLVPMGGAGPLHAAEVAAELAISRILVPLYPGNLSAVGLMGADIRYDLARTCLSECSSDAMDRIRAEIAQIVRDGRRQLETDGFGEDSAQIEMHLDMRYRGQAFDLSIPYDLDADGAESLVGKFEGAYQERYGFGRRGKMVEVVTLRVAAIGKVDRPAPSRYSGTDIEQPAKTRSIYWEGAWVENCRVLEREHLAPGRKYQAPVIVEEFGSTTFVPPGWTLAADECGNLRIERS